MLNVTPAALERLFRKLTHKKAAGDVALRFHQAEGRWKLQTDRARPDDATFAHRGRSVLLLDKAAARAMTTMTLDVRPTDSGPRLKLSKAAPRRA
jgi:hypothetical protein